MESLAASLLKRMTTMEEMLRIIQAECQLFRRELTGINQVTDNKEGLAESKTTREMVEKIAWDVEKIKTKILADHPACETNYRNGAEESSEINLEVGILKNVAQESEIEEEEILELPEPNLSMAEIRTKTFQEESTWLVKTCKDNLKGQSVDWAYQNYDNISQNVPYVHVQIANYVSRPLVNTNIIVRNGTHTFGHVLPIETHREVGFAINAHTSGAKIEFQISTEIEGTGQKLCIAGNYLDPQAFVGLVMVRSSSKIPDKMEQITEFIKLVTSQDDHYRADFTLHNPVHVNYGVFQESSAGCGSILTLLQTRVNDISGHGDYPSPYKCLLMTISILESPDTPSYVRASLVNRNLNIRFTFPLLETVRKNTCYQLKPDTSGICTVDITNLASTNLHNPIEYFPHSCPETKYRLFVDPLTSKTRVVVTLPCKQHASICNPLNFELVLIKAFSSTLCRKPSNYIAYNVHGSDLSLVVFWNMFENSNCFALAFIPRSMEINLEFQDALFNFKGNDFGCREDRGFANVEDEPQAFTIRSRNMRVWASMTPGSYSRLKVVFYTV